MLKVYAKEELVKRFLKDVLSDEEYVLNTFKNSEDKKTIFFEVAEEEFSEFKDVVFKCYLDKEESMSIEMNEQVLNFLNELIDYDFAALEKELEKLSNIA